jgi:hypothetical protein
MATNKRKLNEQAGTFSDFKKVVFLRLFVCILSPDILINSEPSNDGIDFVLSVPLIPVCSPCSVVFAAIPLFT